MLPEDDWQLVAEDHDDAEHAVERDDHEHHEEGAVDVHHALLGQLLVQVHHAEDEGVELKGEKMFTVEIQKGLSFIVLM